MDEADFFGVNKEFDLNAGKSDSLSRQQENESQQNQLSSRMRETSLEGLVQLESDLLDRVQYYFRERNYHSAKLAAIEATEALPNNPAAWYLRGVASTELQESSAAEFELGEAIRLEPYNAGYHAALAEIYEINGNFRLAEQSYQQALTLDPDNVTYKVDLASLQVVHGHPQAALPVLEQAVYGEPDSKYFKYQLALALISDIENNCSQFGDGSTGILNRAQLHYTKLNLVRLDELDADDPEVRRHIQGLKRMTDYAENIHWIEPQNPAFWGVAALAAIVAACYIGVNLWIGLLGISGLVLLAVLYVKLNRIPGYAESFRHASRIVRNTGLQSLSGATYIEG